MIYGLDADLIMLGLGTHEPHFRVLREDVFAQDSRQKSCKICGQTGHPAEQCTGKAKEKAGEFDEKATISKLKPFIWLHVGILREYLEVELDIREQGFKFDLERALDDWVFMCFFVGNDFLPHLPSLEIRDGGIDTLMSLWKENLPLMGGYITKDGNVNLERVQYVLDGLAALEDGIFRKRKQGQDRRDAQAKRRKIDEQNSQPGWRGKNGTPVDNRSHNKQDAPTYQNAIITPAQKSQSKLRPEAVPPPMIPLIRPGDISQDTKKLNHDMVMNRDQIRKANLENRSAAQALRSQLLSGKMATAPVVEPPTEISATASTEDGGGPEGPGHLVPAKRKADEQAASEPGTPSTPMEDEAPVDDVRLWEAGYRDRYYEQKFSVDKNNTAFREQVAAAYVEGLCWVLKYYFQGCPSWNWYYPYHYAPFAQDFTNVKNLNIKFNKGTPFKPFEQLMGVLPAASKHNLPEPFQKLMTEESSDIIDFYPEDFPIDLNGKKFAWQGVALLPFIDETRLLEAAQKVYPNLTNEDRARNALGHDTLLISDSNPLYEDIVGRFYSKKQDVSVCILPTCLSFFVTNATQTYKISPKKSEGLAGVVTKDPSYIPRSTLSYPLGSGDMPDLEDDKSMSLVYEMPKSKNVHKSMLLRGVRFNPPVLTRADIEQVRSGRSGRGRGGGFGGGGGGYRGSSRGNSGPGYGNSGGSFRGRSSNNYPPPPPGNSYPPPPGGTWGNYPPPPPGSQSWGNSYDGRGPPPTGNFGGYPPQPPPGVRDGGSYVGAPPGVSGGYGGYNNNGGNNSYGQNDYNQGGRGGYGSARGRGGFSGYQH